MALLLRPRHEADASDATLARRLDLRWLVRLRWGAVALSLLALMLAYGVFGVDLPLLPSTLVVAALGATNAWLGRRLARVEAAPSRSLVGGVALLDMALLTELLALSGGPMNPFSVLYLVYVALAAVLLEGGWTWLLVGASATLFGALFALAPGGGHGAHVERHLYGMWGAYTLAAVLIAAFVGRVSGALRRREAELRAAQERVARADRLAALTTLAAGAAHELGSPLGTIAVAARDLEDALDRDGATKAFVEDARLIRNEVRRCRGILDQMSADAGELAGEGLVPVGLGELLDDVLGHLPEGLRTRVSLAVPPGLVEERLRVPPRAFARVLENLLENALRASPGEDAVEVRVAREPGGWRFVVADRGVGMTAEVLERAGEPFFTTRDPGEGLGLGLFIARTCVDRLGGSLGLESAPGVGTTATVELPA